GFDDAACEAAITQADWPARMQRLRKGPLVKAAGQAQLWLDGGHNAAAGAAIAKLLAKGNRAPTHLICGMLRTKDASGYMGHLAPHVAGLHAVSIPGEAATLSAAETAQAARSVGIDAHEAETVAAALADIVAGHPQARVLICGSLYLAGAVLRENG
ncbi:MAG: bifunctional folylpolyglutamate synthase/dihydrofolate synthase, partial [Pseudomonadota bacterium]